MNCPVCSDTNLVNYISCLDYTVSHKKFQIQRCASCGFLLTNPRPDYNEIGDYYKSENYISHTNAKKGVFNTLYQTIRKSAIEGKIKLIRQITGKKEGIRLLDIGCGTGEFLNGCQSIGWKVKGVEPSEDARKQAQFNYKLDVAGEAYLENSNDQYDVITMWHVLEHVHDLNRRLEQIKQILTQDGVLIIAVPNHTAYDSDFYKEYWAAWDVPRHLYHFSPATLKRLMEKHGYQHIQSDPMKYDSYYVSLLSTEYKSGKKNFLEGAMKGFQSNMKAGGRPEKYSSVIYSFRKEGSAR